MAIEAEEDRNEREEMRREMREMTEVEGVELYPPDPDSGDRATFDDAERPLPTFTEDMQMSWGDGKPGARDRGAALMAFGASLEELFRREDLRDPADPTGQTVIITVDLLTKTYKYRSRPFFSDTLRDVNNGRIGSEQIGTTLILSFAGDLAPAGTYRLQRPRSGHVG